MVRTLLSSCLQVVAFGLGTVLGFPSAVVADDVLRDAVGEVESIVDNLREFADRLDGLTESRDNGPVLETVESLTRKLDTLEQSCESSRRRVVEYLDGRRRSLGRHARPTIWKAPPWARNGRQRRSGGPHSRSAIWRVPPCTEDGRRRGRGRDFGARRRHARAFAALVVQRLGRENHAPRKELRQLDLIAKEMEWVHRRTKKFFDQLRGSLKKTASAARDSQVPYRQPVRVLGNTPRELVEVMERVQKSMLKVMENQVHVLESVTGSGSEEVTSTSHRRESNDYVIKPAD